MNPTHPLARRIAAGLGISLFGSLALAAFLAPAGAFEGRAASVRVHGPAMTLPTATTAARVEATPSPAPQPTVTTTTTRPVPAATPVRRYRPRTTTTAPVRTAGEHACPDGSWAPTC